MPKQKCVSSSILSSAKDLNIQSQKDAAIQSLLFVTRKLGEIEGIISTQEGSNEDLLKIQNDFLALYDKLAKTIGVQELRSSSRSGIGGEYIWGISGVKVLMIVQINTLIDSWSN